MVGYSIKGNLYVDLVFFLFFLFVFILFPILIYLFAFAPVN